MFSQEFKDMCAFCKDNDIPLYVTLAKPVGTARESRLGLPEIGCRSAEVLETEYNVFTHMSPNYGQPGAASP